LSSFRDGVVLRYYFTGVYRSEKKWAKKSTGDGAIAPRGKQEACLKSFSFITYCEILSIGKIYPIITAWTFCFLSARRIDRINSMREIVVVLHNIRSVYNVASIFRTADGAGVKKIYLCGITPTPLDRLGRPREDFAKVSLGAEKFVTWDKRAKTGVVLNELRKDGYKIFALEQSAKSIPYYKLKTKNYKFALVLGNEVRGLSPSVLKEADKIIEIPMWGKKESLNVSVAFGIVVYQLALIFEEQRNEL
jgi:tRNA(Leu) C34 or U34 (ribose-2'-O)-methylase TrmL